MNIDYESSELTTVRDPPGQSSPKHILNALNNDCLQEVLRRLKDIGDFLIAAEVCTQFSENARQCFPPIYKTFYLTYAVPSQYSKLSPHNVLSIDRMESFLNIFGDLIEKIVWGSEIERDYYENRPYKASRHQYRFRRDIKEDQEYDTNHLKIIAEHCGKTLKELHIWRRFVDFNIMQKFKTLEKLVIWECDSIYCTDSFRPGLFSNLKYLNFDVFRGQNYEWLEQTFPNLIKAGYSKGFRCVPIKQNTVVKFIKLNPQLKHLTWENREIDSSFWHAFDDSRPSDLQYLNIEFGFRDEIEHFGKFFSNLKCFYIDCKITNRFIDLLVQNNIPIELFFVSHMDLDIFTFMEAISKLTHIKGLQICGSIVGYNQKSFLQICKSIPPTLKYLQVSLNEFFEAEIIEALKITVANLEGLKILIIDTTSPSITVNTNFYYEILNLVKNRLKINLKCHSNSRILIEKSVLEMNENWLKINTNWSSMIRLSELIFGENHTKICEMN